MLVAFDYHVGRCAPGCAVDLTWLVRTIVAKVAVTRLNGGMHNPGI